jgi:hypothetical protein
MTHNPQLLSKAIPSTSVSPMAARFIDIAEFVFDEIDEIFDLLPFRAVARGVKLYADRRICQIILHAVATRPDSAENPDIGGMGVIQVLSYDDPPLSFSSQTLLEYQSDTAVTYGDILDQVLDYDNQLRFFDAEVDFVASQVIVEADQGCKIRFKPRSSPALFITTSTYLQYFCLAPTGPRLDAKILDSITVEPDAQDEELRETVSAFGSSFVFRRTKVQSVANDLAAVSMVEAFTELPFDHSHSLELVYLDAPISLLLRGLPDWEDRPEEDGSDWDQFSDNYHDYFRGWWLPDRQFDIVNDSDYDIDNDSDFWRRAMD